LDVTSSSAILPPWHEHPATHFHAIQVVYRVRITGGTLRPEVGGTTDDVRWFARAELASLPTVELVADILPQAFGPSTGDA
jgi:ADP-ribose pyrophosphatase YjhB (NUDIX family)